MNKRFLLTVLIVVMCFMIATPVFASNIKGFGDYYVEETPDGEIVIYIDEYMADEEYKLSVAPKRIDITAAKPAGFFYAFQTLKQLNYQYNRFYQHFLLLQLNSEYISTLRF